jgi:signal transduction histidine kinase
MAGAFHKTFFAILNPIPAQQILRRYTIALACSALAILLRWLLDPVLGHLAFYVTVYIAVAYCTMVCGYVPAIVTAVVGLVGTFYWFVDPRHSLFPTHRSEVHGVIGFFLLSTVLIWLGEANRRKQMRLNEVVDELTSEVRERKRAQQDLRIAHDELEHRVLTRTQELSQALSRLRAEVSVREHTEERLRHLSLRLMTLQDEERRRIARELHDTCGQTLAAMKMSIALLRQGDKSAPGFLLLINDLNTLTDEALQEVRTASYLLHPPLLDEAGIASAARWFVEGFSRRSGIDVQCEIPDKMERTSRPCELVLFRILQESLTNVHRHSGASAARVRLDRNSDHIELEIADNGKGISEERLRQFENSGNSGVGITGMRERVHELGGHLEVRSLHPGTSVCVALPLANPAVTATSPQVSVSL